MIKFLKQLFCFHRWEETIFPHTMYVTKLYQNVNKTRKCQKCGKIQWWSEEQYSFHSGDGDMWVTIENEKDLEVKLESKLIEILSQEGQYVTKNNKVL